MIAEVEDDHFHAMQRSLSSDTGQDTLFTPRSESSSGNRDLQEWNIDLQRLVDRHISQCPLEQNAEEEFLFSVYTWYIDHSSHQACFTTKIAILGGDPTEWEEDLRHPWRFHIRPDLPLFIDMVSPFTPRADVEEHIAHVLFSQGTSRLSTVLVSLEFIAPTTPHVIVRCAVLCQIHALAKTLGMSFHCLHVSQTTESDGCIRLCILPKNKLGLGMVWIFRCKFCLNRFQHMMCRCKMSRILCRST